MEEASSSQLLKGTGGGENSIKPQFQTQVLHAHLVHTLSNSRIGEANDFKVASLFGCNRGAKGAGTIRLKKLLFQFWECDE